MSKLMKLELLGQVITLSEETEYCMTMHENFCSPGSEWLLKHDPDCSKEQDYIEMVRESFLQDFENSIKTLPEDVQDELMDEFLGLSDIEYWMDLRAAVGIEGD